MTTGQYSTKTLIGNWNEERTLSHFKAVDYNKAIAEVGTSEGKMTRFKMDTLTTVVPISYSDDGLIRFGDTVILGHDSTRKCVGCDNFNEVLLGQQKFAVSGVEFDASKPLARNTFVVTQPPASLLSKDFDPSDPLLRIGQPFQLRCNKSLLVASNSNVLNPMLYLSSTKKNERTATRGSNKQMIFLSPTQNIESIWSIAIPSEGRLNGTARLLKLGTPVNIDDGYIVKHDSTNIYMTMLQENEVVTEFGVEIECVGDRASAFGKLGLMVSEQSGASTVNTLTKQDAPVFIFHFITASDPSNSVDNNNSSTSRNLPPDGTINNVIEELRQNVAAMESFQPIHEYFDELQKRLVKPGALDREDLNAAMRDYLDNALTLSPARIDEVIGTVDNGSGLIRISEFLALLK